MSEVRKSIGQLLYLLQIGKTLKLPHSRSMKSLHSGCFELRFKDTSGLYRVFYYFKLENKILIFHAFKKKTQKTPKKELQNAKKILMEMLNDS